MHNELIQIICENRERKSFLDICIGILGINSLNRNVAISVELAKRMNITPLKALEMFYESRTCAELHDRSKDLYLYSDLYVADEYMRELDSTRF